MTDTLSEDAFRDWLNCIDALIGYEKRFQTGSVATWRDAFDDGNSERGACRMFGVLPIQLR